MDRQRRSASKITDYRRFHLSGDLDKIVQGKVSETVVLLQGVEPTSMSTNDIEESTSTEELQELLKEQKETSARLKQQVEAMKVRNELEAEKMQQVQWELAITQLKHNREVMMQQHEENMARIRDMTPEPAHSDQAVTWLKTQLGEPTQPPREDTSSKSNNTQKEFLLEQLHMHRRRSRGRFKTFQQGKRNQVMQWEN